MNSAPAPFVLRRFLLAADTDYGLDYAAVCAMTAQEFALNWAIYTLVKQASTQDGREDMQRDRSVQRAIALERTGIPVASTRAFDPETATPAELDAWIRSLEG